MDSYDDKREEAYWDLREREEADKEKREYLKTKLTPYKEIARDALVNFFRMDREEATEYVRRTSNEELEDQVGAKGSIAHGLEGIKLFANENMKKEFGFEPKVPPISDEQIAELTEAIMNGPVDSDIFHTVEGNLGLHFHDSKRRDEVMAKAKQNGEEIDWKEVYAASHKTTHEFIMSVLTNIHDGWVKDYPNKFLAREKKFQHMPIELIGWNEVKSDLVFLKPILSAMKIDFSEEVLEEVYDERVKAFFEDRGITDIDELAELISKGAEFYPALEGQDAILDKLKDSKFVAENVIPSIKEKGVGSDKKAMEALGKLTPKKTISMKAVVSNSIENGITTDEVQKAEREENEIEQAKEGVEVND